MAKRLPRLDDAPKPLEQQPDAPGGTTTPPVTTPPVTSGKDDDDEKLDIPERAFTDADLALVSASQREGIQAGNIVASWDTVTVSGKKSPTGKAAFRYYIRLEALNGAGGMQMFNGKINAATPSEKVPEGSTADQREALTAKGMCDYANYGADLERRAAARTLLLSELEGPEKVVKKAVAAFLGMEYEPDMIRQLILTSPKYKGIDGLAKIVDSALSA